MGPYLRAREQVHIPLLIPRGPLRHLSVAENPHDVGRTEAYEPRLADAVSVRAVEARLADGALLEKDQSSSESLPVRWFKVE